MKVFEAILEAIVLLSASAAMITLTVFMAIWTIHEIRDRKGGQQ